MLLRSVGRYCWRCCRLFSWLWVLTVLLLTLAWIWLERSPELMAAWTQDILTEQYDIHVKVDQVRLSLDGWVPALAMDNINIPLPDGGDLQIQKTWLRLALWESLRGQHWVGSRLHVQGGHIVLALPALSAGDGERNKQQAQKKQDWLKPLLKQRHVTVHDFHVRVRLKSGKLVDLPSVDMDFRRSGRHVLAWLQGRQKGGGRARLQVDVTQQTQNKGWTGAWYMQFTAMHWPQPEQLKGKLNGRFWVQMHDSQWQQGKGIWDWLHPVIEGHRLPLHQLSAQMAWQPDKDAWQISLPHLAVRSQAAGHPMLWNSSAVLRWSPAEELGDVWLHDLPLSLLHSMVKTFNPAFTAAAELKGSVHDLRLLWQQDNAELQHWQLQGKVQQLALNWPQHARVRGLNGYIQATEQQGYLDWASAALRLDLRPFFRASWPAMRSHGRMYWQSSDDGSWQVQTRAVSLRNDDVQVKLAADLKLPVKTETGSPRLRLQATVERANVAAMRRYFPSSIMSQGLLDWLDQALLAGQAAQGSIRVDGPLNQQLFDGRGFQARFHVAEGRLSPAPGWPLIEDIDADVAFIGNSLQVNGQQGRIYDTDLQQVRVAMDDMRNGQLHIAGQATGSLLDADHYLRASPLNDLLSGLTRTLQVQGGSSHLTLDLQLPLNAPEKLRLEGDLAVTQGQLQAVGHVPIAQVKGQLHFTEQTVEAKDMEAVVMGFPATVDLHTQQNSTGKSYQFQAHGPLNAHLLDRFLGIHSVEDISGEGVWQGQLSLPTGAGQVASLDLHSDTLGLASHLPKPLDKEPNFKKNFHLKGFFPANAPPHYKLQWGEGIHAMLQADSAGDLRGWFAVGRNGEVLLPEQGFMIVSKTPYLDADAWIGAASRLFGQTDKGTEQSSAPRKSLPLQFRFQLDSLHLMGQNWSEVTAQMEADKGLWKGHLASPRLAGSFQLDLSGSQTVLAANLERLWLPDSDAVPADQAVPDEAAGLALASLPDITLVVDNFRMGAGDFGLLNLIASHDANDPAIWNIQNLELARPESWLTGSGRWQSQEGRPVLSMDLKLKSDDFGTTLKQWGYADGLRHGHLGGEAKISWQGRPGALVWMNPSQGSLSFSVHNGELHDIKPGAGKLFGLLSFQALPRRLTLDFKDLFRSGFVFDEMAGSFAIKDGNARTDNMTLLSPSVHMQLRGRIGLRQRDFDQLVIVVPQLGSSLPVAGAVLGGPVGAAAVLVIQQVFNKSINGLVRHKYRITGSWEDPVVKKK